MALPIAPLFVVLLWSCLLQLSTCAPGQSRSCDDVNKGYTCQIDISRLWGPYSPWYAVHSDVSPDVPPQCKVTFAQILSRHGARYPHADKSAEYAKLIASIQKAVPTFKGNYQFLQKYQYDLGAEDLTKFGAQELRNSGTDFFNRYHELAIQGQPIFVRASSQQRVVDSATNFTQGFYAAKGSANMSAWSIATSLRGPKRPTLGQGNFHPQVVINEAAGSNSNNTLCPQITCPTFLSSTTANDKSALYASAFLPAIASRLNGDLPGVNLTTNQVMDLMDMCPFSTVADTTGTPSPFCALFTTDEWAQYDYYGTVFKWYSYGPGNALGPSQGVGFANEIIARLTQKPVIDHTTVNHTLDDNSETTFPLDNTLYADFSHEEGITAIMFALGLFNGTKTVSTDKLMTAQELNGYTASRSVPFAARMVVEKMQCQGDQEEKVRVLVNDEVVPLSTCSSVDSLGRCALSDFVNSLSFVQEGGDWDQCGYTGGKLSASKRK